MEIGAQDFSDDWDDADDDILSEAVQKCNPDSNEEKSSTSLHSQDQEEDKRSPLERFRPGYLWVSDLTRQNWCEQQLYYSFTVPGIVEEKPVMTEGSNLHLARELAVHDIVNVTVTSSEDVWAIKVLNLLTAVQAFANNKCLAREVPIFGAPFKEDVFMVGLIDELRFDPEAYQIDLVELKTRKFKSMPKAAQQTQHRLQVMLYKKLFDDLVKGQLEKEVVANHLRLDLSKEFCPDIQTQVDNAFLSSKNLDQLMDVAFRRMQTLTCVKDIRIEYVHQQSEETLFEHGVSYDESELKSLYTKYLQFWRGERESCGVEIEEAWKCQTCDYSEVCEWREKKSREYAQKNVRKSKNSLNSIVDKEQFPI